MSIRPDTPMSMTLVQQLLEEANVILERHDKGPITMRVTPGDPSNPPAGWLHLVNLFDGDGAGPLMMDAEMNVLARTFLHGNQLEVLCQMQHHTYGEMLWIVVDGCGVPC